jgi:hypothetical protein
MNARPIILALTALAAVAGSTLIAAAQSNDSLSLHQGTQLTAQLRRDLNTGNAQVGDHVMLDVVEPYPNGNFDLNGAQIDAEVTSVTPAGQGRKPSIGLQFDYLRLNDGTKVDIDATMTGDQRVQQQKSGLHVLLDTVGGMFLGNAVGKTIFHTGGGGIAGAAGGFMYGQNQQANFDLPRGSSVQLTLNQPIVVRRQSSGVPPG